MVQKDVLIRLYIKKKLSTAQIATQLQCSQGKINYWLTHFQIKKRSIKDAVYLKCNPTGDPFSFKRPKSVREGVLFGMGIGLYWGEGTKANKNSVRLANSNPALIKRFIDFLTCFYQIDKSRLRFGLQVFADMDPAAARLHWARHLRVPESQFYPKVIVTPYRGVGNYRNKTKYGVLTVYFNNSRLRDIICRAIDAESMQ